LISWIIFVFFFFIYKFKTKERKRMNLNLFKNTIFYSLSLNYERWICWCSRVFFSCSY
jgi:hypothetical protein